MSVLKWGLIGAGDIAKRRIAPAFAISRTASLYPSAGRVRNSPRICRTDSEHQSGLLIGGNRSLTLRSTLCISRRPSIFTPFRP